MQGNSFRRIPEALWNIPVDCQPLAVSKHSAREFSVRVPVLHRTCRGLIPAHAHKTVITALGGVAQMGLRSQSTRTIG